MAIIIDETENKRVVSIQDILGDVEIALSTADEGSWPRRRSGCVKNGKTGRSLALAMIGQRRNIRVIRPTALQSLALSRSSEAVPEM